MGPRIVAPVRWLQLVEPAVLAERLMLEEDDVIRATDVPERMQVRSCADTLPAAARWLLC